MLKRSHIRSRVLNRISELSEIVKQHDEDIQRLRRLYFNDDMPVEAMQPRSTVHNRAKAAVDMRDRPPMAIAFSIKDITAPLAYHLVRMVDNTAPDKLLNIIRVLHTMLYKDFIRLPGFTHGMMTFGDRKGFYQYVHDYLFAISIIRELDIDMDALVQEVVKMAWDKEMKYHNR